MSRKIKGTGEGQTPESGQDLSRREFVETVGAGAAAVAAVAAVTGSASTAFGATLTTPVYRIHPAIGVARLGNLDPNVGFVVGPEIPSAGPTDGLTGNPVANHKVNGQVKPQAARFRIWEYALDSSGRLAPKGEVTVQAPTAGKPFVKAITWTVHLANRKSSFFAEDGPHGETLPAGELRNPAVTDRASLESDFGPRTISGKSAAPVAFTPGNGGAYPVRSVKRADGSTVIDYLGQLRTDASGRLLVLGGKGTSASSLTPAQPLTHWANNNYWFDDISDGPVTAVVTLDDGYGKLTQVPMDAAGNAWVLSTPPNFNPGIFATVSLYDLLFDMGVRSLPVPTNNALYYGTGPLARLTDLNTRWVAWKASKTPGPYEFGNFKPDYLNDIWPLVLNAVNLVYTTGLVNAKHSCMLTDPLGDPSAAAIKERQAFFGYIRAPGEAATNTTGPATMPRQYGDNWYVGNENFHYTFGQNGTGGGGGVGGGAGGRQVPKYQRYATVTPTQYGLLKEWAAGNFVAANGSPTIATEITPHGLDRAALEACCGAPFYPGIECGWQMRNPALFIEPFRLNHAALSQYRLPSNVAEGTQVKAGHFSRQMAVPWQADFNDCSKLLNLAWWPASRPDDVFLNPTDKLTQRVPWARPDTKWPSGSTGSSYEDMVTNWYKFGFILEAGFGVFVEMERNTSVP